MKEKKKIKYKSIFKYPEHQETLSYEAIGSIEIGESHHIRFKDQDILFNLTIKGDQAILKNNDNTILLMKDVITTNEYNTPYGTCMIQCKLKSIEINTGYKIVYDIVDQDEVVSSVYIMIRYFNVEEVYEA